jgi:hypothetical protein
LHDKVFNDGQAALIISNTSRSSELTENLPLQEAVFRSMNALVFTCAFFTCACKSTFPVLLPVSLKAACRGILSACPSTLRMRRIFQKKVGKRRNEGFGAFLFAGNPESGPKSISRFFKPNLYICSERLIP